MQLYQAAWLVPLVLFLQTAFTGQEHPNPTTEPERLQTPSLSYAALTLTLTQAVPRPAPFRQITPNSSFRTPALPSLELVVGVQKNNREISLRRILAGQSVLVGLLEADALRTEPSREKIYCATIELHYLLQVCCHPIAMKWGFGPPALT